MPYSDRPSLVSQSAISCIAAHARLNSALWTRWMGDFTRLIAPPEIDPNGSAAGVTRHRRAAGGSRLSAAATDRPQALLGPFTHWEVFYVHHPLGGRRNTWQHCASE
jgi:hypothetical protein